jgi:hypothetical protein
MSYRRPPRNPLYRSLSGVRRGLGDAPIDIGTSATVVVGPDTTTITPTGGAPVSVPTVYGGGGSMTDWLNANSKTLLWIAGISAGVLVLSRMGR